MGWMGTWEKWWKEWHCEWFPGLGVWLAGWMLVWLYEIEKILQVWSRIRISVRYPKIKVTNETARWRRLIGVHCVWLVTRTDFCANINLLHEPEWDFLGRVYRLRRKETEDWALLHFSIYKIEWQKDLVKLLKKEKLRGKRIWGKHNVPGNNWINYKKEKRKNAWVWEIVLDSSLYVLISTSSSSYRKNGPTNIHFSLMLHVQLRVLCSL